jgi:hypothetical protein
MAPIAITLSQWQQWVLKRKWDNLAIKPGMVFAQFNANYVPKNRIFDTSYAYDLGKYFKIFSKISLFYPKLFIFFFYQSPLEPGRNQDILSMTAPQGSHIGVWT